MRNRLGIIIGVALGIITVIMVRFYIQQREHELTRELRRGQEPTPVLIAQENIATSTVIRDEMVALENRPSYSIQPHALVDPADAVGKVALVPLYKGEQVSDSKLARHGAVHALSVKTPPGKRAVTIGVDILSGVGGLVKPGDHVDILGVFAVPGGGDKSVLTMTLLQRVEVLAVGTQLSEREDEEEGGGHAANPAANVTLALTPQDAQLILFARAAQAQLQLTLRPPADTTAVANLTPTTQETLLGLILGPQALELAKQAQAASLQKVSPKTVEIFRGLEKEVVQLPDSSSR